MSSDGVLVVFDEGVGIEIKASDGALSIILVVPDSFRGHTKGLMGTWNGDDKDDFLTPDGITLRSNLTTEELHDQFGLLCKIMLMILLILLLGPIAVNGNIGRFNTIIDRQIALSLFKIGTVPNLCQRNALKRVELQ